MGNPVAVILDSDGLTGEQMQRIARWTNLSETTFITPATSSDADYALRIFTPNSEIPFAGHPTLGSAHAWHEQHPEHTADRIIQQCGAGLVEIRTINGQYFFKAPDTIRSGPLSDAELDHLTAGLGLLAGMLSRTSGWTTVQVGRAFSSPAPRRSPLLNPISIYLTTPWWALWVRTTPAAPTLLRCVLSPPELGYRKIRSPVASTLRLRSG